MSDPHYLGEFQSLSAVWKKFPNGGGYGDYVTILGVRYDWDESTNSWGEDPGDVNPALPEIVNHDIDVQGTVIARDGIKTADYIPDEAGAHIDHAGNAEFRTLKADTVRVQDPLTGKLIPLAEFIKMFKTELPPDWTEYKQIPQFDDVRILAFDPISDEKFYTTIGALKKLIRDSIAAGGVGTGTFDIEILRTDDPDAIPTDNNVMSSLRTLMAIQATIAPLTGEYLSRINDDTASGLIKFLAGAEFGEFLSGILGGKGARIDELGNIEATSLALRGFLSAPEYRFNRITFVGDEIIFSDMGTIEEVELLEGRLYRLTMRLEEGDNLTFKAGDLVKGIYHYNTYGFSTSYMRVESVIDEYMEVLLVDNEDTPTLSNYPPTQFMKIARVGYAGVDFPERSRYVVASSKVGGIQVWDGCVDFLSGRIVASMDLSQAFKSQYGPLPTKDGLPYLYAAGIVTEHIIRIDYEGVPVREVYDRGAWEAGRIYYNNDENGTDDVWHLGVRWRCFASSTTEEPSWTSADWVNIEGRPNMMVVIEQYYISTSSSELVGGVWTEEIPTWEEGKYIYSRSKILYQDGSETFTDPVYVPILNGKSVTKIDVEYATSSSRQIAPTGGWQTTDPGVQPGEYLWSRTIVYYSDGTHEIFGEACISGNDGEAGKDAVAPTIIDGFWAFWDDDLNDYVVSSFSAIGDDGHSPYVDGNTGTWWEWNDATGTYQDTGFTAEGKDGVDGYSVSLSKSEHTFNYDKNGNLKGILSDGAISVEVLNGSNPHICDSLAVSPPTLDGTYRVTDILISPSTTLSYNVDRQNNIYRIIPTMIDAEEVMVTLTIVARAKGVNTTFTRQLKYQKSHDGKDGTDGEDGVDGTDGDSVVHIYRQYPTKPATPSSGVANPTGWSRNPDYSLSIVSQTNWTVNGNWYQSEELTAIGNSTTSRITFTTAKDAQTITLELWADGHATYDYVYAGNLDSAVSTSNYYKRVRAGRIIITYDVPAAGSHYIDIFWRKGIATIVGSNRGYYAIISDVKVWRSTTNVIGGVFQDWSEPQQFLIDTSTEERIYCLSKTTTAPPISDSDAYINDYIPLPCSLSSYRGDFATYRAYSIGQVVKYQLQYYKVIQTVLGTYTGNPLNTQYFEKIPGWTDNPIGANKDYPFEFVAIRKKQSDGLWGSFVPSVWSNYGIGTNYIPMGWWKSDVTYSKTDLGIPLIKKEDGTALGYSVYTLKVAASTPGTFILSEWDLVESADFIYMQQAYIERLQAQLISAVTVELKEDLSSNVTAGISGIQGSGKDLPAIWAGGTYAEAIAGTAKAIIRHDGASKFTDTEIEGKITATSGFLGALEMKSGGYIDLPPTFASRKGRLDNAGLQLVYQSGDSQKIEWYSGMGTYAGKITCNSSGRMQLSSTFGVGIGLDAYEDAITITAGAGFYSNINLNSSVVSNIRQLLQVGILNLNYTTHSLSANTNYHISNDTTLIILTSVGDGGSIYRITGPGGASPNNGDVRIIMNTSPTHYCLLKENVTNSNIKVLVNGGPWFRILQNSIVVMVYYNGYWRIQTDWGQPG